MTTSLHVGLIGVGLMGHGIATSLLRADHRLSFLDHPGNQPSDDLIDKGASALVSNSSSELSYRLYSEFKTDTVQIIKDHILAGLCEVEICFAE